MKNQLLGKLLYGFLFTILLPVLLVLWARATSASINLPVPNSLGLGVVVASFGLVIMLTGMANLFLIGGGMPMNAYPPPRYVTEGIYRFMPHPIYFGFAVACAGISIVFQSPSGLWLISPLVAMGCASLVYGYENEAIAKHFGVTPAKGLISLAADDPRPPALSEKLSVFALVFLPWLIAYEAVVTLGIAPDSTVAYLDFEKDWPVLEWTEIFYFGTYAFVVFAPFTARQSRHLRQFSIAGIWATVIITMMFLTIPLISPPREFTPQGFLGSFLLWERTYDSAGAAFPSFHAVWVLLSAWLYSKSLPRLAIVWWTIALLISISCITTGMHALLDVVAGMLIVPLLLNMPELWEKVRSLSERIANSWKEWLIGPVRIINHGMYSGAGGAIGLMIIGTVLGPDSVGPMFLVAMSTIIGAGLWAQFVEGSPSLLRPYGYYGSIIGGTLGCALAVFIGGDFWQLIGAFSLAAPIIQAAGRVRCLVQGCCHGHEAPVGIGIRYTHPRSRVCRLSHLENIPLHPTPLYSILWCLLITVPLARLWSLHASLTLITGLYFILNGLGRFVEEAYRGEPQTPFLGGLRLYQWAAITSIVAGAVITALPTTSTIPVAEFSWPAIWVALGFGLITWFMQGVDFPNSNARFSRLV